MGTRIVIALAMAWLAALPISASAQARPVVSAQAMAMAGSNGRVRVVVMLKSPAVSRPKTERIAQLDATTDAVLSRLPTGQVLRRQFALVPAMVLEVDMRGLQALARDPAVLRVDPDVGGSGHGDTIRPDRSSVLNHVSSLQALGLDGSGRKVAVIDTGVATDHADLRNRLLDQACFCSAQAGSGGCCPNGSATQTGPGAAEDDNGHGTNVAGIVVGEGTQAPRGALPAARLIAVKVIGGDNRFCCTSDVVAAMDWVATHHPDVAAVNLSLGTDAVYAGDCDGANAWTQALASAVHALVSNGAVVTVSSGNEGDLQGMSAPACVRDAFSVAATWSFDYGSTTFLGCSEVAVLLKPTCFSNRGATTDLFAAGAYVTSTGYTGGTSSYGGTSQAAPMAAACAVALKQAAPAATVAQRMDAMTLSRIRIPDPASGRVYAFLDCFDAVMLLNPALIHAVPLNGSQPLLPPASARATSRLPALRQAKTGDGAAQNLRGEPAEPIRQGPLRRVR